MILKSEFIERYPSLEVGTPVFTHDGERLGQIQLLGDDHFIIEKGFFFPKQFTARYDDITRVEDGKVTLSYASGTLRPWRDEGFGGWSEYDREQISAYDVHSTPSVGSEVTDNDEIRVPLREEEVQTTRVVQPAGAVTVRKKVHTELRHFSVPVRVQEIEDTTEKSKKRRSA